MPPDPARTDASRRFSPLERTYLWMLLPAVVVLALTVVVPLGLLLRNSLYHWQFSKPWLTGFVGLENYREMLQDARFGASIWRAFVFIASTVAAEVGLALSLAELLSVRVRGMSLVKSGFLLPMVLPPIVVGSCGASCTTHAWHRELLPALHRAGSGLAGRAGPGAVRPDRGGRLAVDALPPADVPGGLCGHPPGALRGGPRGRRQPVAPIPGRHLAAAPRPHRGRRPVSHGGRHEDLSDHPHHDRGRPGRGH